MGRSLWVTYIPHLSAQFCSAAADADDAATRLNASHFLQLLMMLVMLAMQLVSVFHHVLLLLLLLPT